MNLFSDAQVRKDFTVGITEVLAQIYKVKDDVLKLSIFNELAKLSDEELIAKKDLIEGYLEHTTQLTQAGINKMTRAENELVEEMERKEVFISL